MANTYTWEFPTLTAYPTQSGHTEVVCNVHWRLTGEDETKTYSSTRYGMISVAPLSSSGSFIPYEELTKQDVEGWVLSAMGDQYYGELTSSLDGAIYQLMHPSTLDLNPPW